MDAEARQKCEVRRSGRESDFDPSVADKAESPTAGAALPLRDMDEPSGVLYGCGSGPQVSGVLTVPPAALDSDRDCRYFTRIPMPPDTPRIAQVACEYSIAIARDVAGGAWIWGSGAGTTQPTRVSCVRQSGDLGNVISCAAASSFAVAVIDDGTVLCFGGKAPGAAVGVGIGGQRGSTFCVRTTRLNFYSKEAEVPPIAVAVDASQSTVLVQTADGALWSAGDSVASGRDCGQRDVAGDEKLHLIHDAAQRPLDNVAAFSVGSIHAAAVKRDGSLWVWGNGVSGNHGLGKRLKVVRFPCQVPGFGQEEGEIFAASVGCTKGSPNPKQIHTKDGWLAGQEGPRTHVVDTSGNLWIAGTGHKGLAADHLYKTLSPKVDHLKFYKVGGPAVLDPGASKVYIGAAENLRTNPRRAAQLMGMAKADDFGSGPDRKTGYLAATKIVQSSPSHIHSMALSEDGRLFTWGCGSNGRCGLEAIVQIQGGKKRTMKCYVHSPSAVESLEGKRVVNAAVGKWWTWAIVEE